MARPKSEMKKREDTEKDLRRYLEENHLSGSVFEDKINEYMSFYDDLKRLESIVNGYDIGNEKVKNLTDVISEKRKVSSEMRNILSFLGIKPKYNESGGRPPASL